MHSLLFLGVRACARAWVSSLPRSVDTWAARGWQCPGRGTASSSNFHTLRFHVYPPETPRGKGEKGVKDFCSVLFLYKQVSCSGAESSTWRAEEGKGGGGRVETKGRSRILMFQHFPGDTYVQIDVDGERAK